MEEHSAVIIILGEGQLLTGGQLESTPVEWAERAVALEPEEK